MYKYDSKSSLEAPTFRSDLDESEGFSPDHDQDSSGVTSISRDLSDAYSFSSVSPYRSDEESAWAGIREAKNENIILGQVDSGRLPSLESPILLLRRILMSYVFLGEGSLDTQPESEYLTNADELNQSASEEPIT